MGVFYVFQIVQMVLNRAKHQIYSFSYLQVLELLKYCKYSKIGPSQILRYPL